LRWIGHLLGALIVGIIVIVVWESYSGVSISETVGNFFANIGIGAGAMIAILVIAAILIWAKSSRG
jgi:hypothetical protein